NGSPFTIGPEDDFTNPTLNPAPSPPSPYCMECMPEPTTDGEPEPTVTDKPLPHRATEPQNVCEPATTPTTREKAVASDIAEGSFAHCNMAE
ncbi:hypothetical protein M9458_043064, partial [Cirrhinus mrigala]